MGPFWGRKSGLRMGLYGFYMGFIWVLYAVYMAGSSWLSETTGSFGGVTQCFVVLALLESRPSRDYVICRAKEKPRDALVWRVFFTS